MTHPSNLLSAAESLLFVSGEPLSFARLAKLLAVPEEEVRSMVTFLKEEYAADTRGGLMIIVDENGALLASKSTNTQYVEALTKSSLQETMSKAALEVLAIVAYRAPITRAEIDAIRGVNCSFTLRNLLLRDLITREGNPSDSRGYIYRPTFRFLQSLGVGGVNELPQYEILARDERLKMILEEPEATLEAEDQTIV